MKTLIPPPIYMLLFATLMWFIDHYISFFIWIEQPWNKIGLGLIVLALLLQRFSVVLRSCIAELLAL